MRVVLMMIWLLAVLAVLYVVWRRAFPPRSRPAPPVDELVKDPVCHTYVARSRAVQRADASGLHYFCSVECARRHAARA